ncbi:CTNA2 protein, partial [Motacilla alba]|nr:CTNA2 protein [Motacilla alba]
LRKAVMDHISDSFLETNVPLLVLIEAAKSGNEKEVKEYAQVFREHANKLVEVSSGSFCGRGDPEIKNNCMGFVNWMKLQKNECILGTQFFNDLQQLSFKFMVLYIEAEPLFWNYIALHYLLTCGISLEKIVQQQEKYYNSYCLWFIIRRFLFLLCFVNKLMQIETSLPMCLGNCISQFPQGSGVHLVGSHGLVHVCLPQLVSNPITLSAGGSLLPFLLWEERLLLSTEAKNLLGTSISSVQTVVSLPVLLIRGDALSVTFLFWLMYLYKPLLFFASPAKFSSIHTGQRNKVGSTQPASYVSLGISDYNLCFVYTLGCLISHSQQMYYSSCKKLFHFRQSLIRTEEGIKWLTCLKLGSHPDDFMISLQVANLACSISNNEEGVKLVRMAATQIDSLCPQVINAALTLAARPQSKVAQDNMDVFKDQWEKQVRVLTEAVDDITSVDDFLSVSENHILEDVNKCVIALQEGDVDTLDRTAGAIRGRAARVIHIINAEMENYETGVYTEKVLEATKLLSETVMPRFAEQVEVAIEALSANVPQPFEENEFIDASRLVYDGVRDIRKAVLMIRTPEELEDDSDFEQEDYDVRSRTSVQTEDDQLIAGQSARAIMAQLPQEEKAKIAEQVEIFHQEKSKLDAEVAKWDDSGNDIIVLAKQMCMIMMEMTDFTRGKGPLKNTSDVINAAKKIAEAGSRMDKLARAVADQCPDSACKQDLLAYLQRIALYCHQLNICSKVKAEVQNLGGELIVSGLDSATSLIQAAKNLMNAVVLTVKASYVASTKYQKVYGTAAVNSPVVSWKMKAPEKKPLVKREKPEEYQTRVRRGSQKKHISPVQALSEFKAMDSF